MKYIVSLFAITSLLLVISCNSPELLGVELLEDESITIEFTNVVNPLVKTIEDDPIIVFASDGFNLRNFSELPLGTYQDMTFGTATSDLYMTPGIGTGNLPDFNKTTFDSIVMILPLDVDPRYGDTLSSYTVDVFRLDEFPSSSTTIAERVDTIYSDQAFDYDTDSPLGSVSLVPRYFDSLEVYSPALDSFVMSRPHVRVRLEDDFGMELLDTMVVNADSTLQRVARGFAITAEGDQPGFIGLNLANFTSSSTNAILSMFYRDSMDVKTQYDFSLGIFKSTNYTHDYAGSAVEMALNGDDTRSYVQGMNGVNTQIDLSGIMDFAGKGINYAELEITVDESMITDTEGAIQSMLATFKNDDGDDTWVVDAQLSTDAATSSILYDGQLQTVFRNGQQVKVYKIVLTNHLRNIISGEISTPIIELIPVGKVETSRRSVLYGNSGDENEIKLNLVVTTP